MPAGLRATRALRKGAILGSALALAAGITAISAGTAVPASGSTAASGASTALRSTSAAAAATAGTLPLLPDGLNVAIGARATANAGSAPGTSLASIDDGDGTTRWCPSSLGIHTVTLDLGRAVDLSGTRG